MMTNPDNPRFAFFGTGPVAKLVLEEMLDRGFRPALVVTGQDAIQGRGQRLTPTPVAIIAENLSVPVRKPAHIDAALVHELETSDFDVFVVADYGALLKKEVLDIPPKGVLNVHPSLLPRLRGPSPIRTAILRDEKETGVSIMLLDEEMDHGPVLAQRKISVEPWPPRALLLEERLGREGGKLLCEMLPLWMQGKIEPRAQNHDVATYTRMIKKSDGEVRLNDDPSTVLRKIRAYEGWPTTFTFFERAGKRIRVQITDAHIEGGMLVVDSVKPEGKAEMPYADFIRSGATPL